MENHTGSTCCVFPITHGSLWNTLHDYTIFDISITLILFSLSHILIILCTFIGLFKKFYSSTYILTWVYNRHFWLFNSTSFIGGISSWVLLGEIPKGVSSPSQTVESLLFWNWRWEALGWRLYLGSGWWRKLFPVQPASLDLFEAFDTTTHSIFPEASPFDFHDVIDKSAVQWSGKTVDFWVRQMWVKTLTLHTSYVAWPGYLTSQAAVSFLQGEEQISLVVQWLGLCASTAGNTGSIPGQGTKILHAMAPPKKERKKQYYHITALKSHLISALWREEQSLQWG